MAGKKEIFLKKEFIPLSNMIFEGKTYCVPRNYELYLSRLYGEWKIPPNNKEIHPMEILFSDTNTESAE